MLLTALQPITLPLHPDRPTLGIQLMADPICKHRIRAFLASVYTGGVAIETEAAPAQAITRTR